MLSSKISARDVDPSLINDLGGATKSYVDQQVINISQTGIPKLMVYPFSIVAETEGQTVFEIPLDTFDANTDTVFVQSGRTMISPNEDFSVVDNSVVLTEGVPVERVITIYVFKNVPIGEDGSVSGSVIMPGSLTLDRLSVMPTAEQVGAVPSAMIEGGLHRSFPEGISTTSTMAEIYDACREGVTMLPPNWACETYSPDGKNHMWQIIVFKVSSNASHNEYINALGLYNGRIYVYNRGSNAWTGFLPITGGTLSGNININTPSYPALNLLNTSSNLFSFVLVGGNNLQIATRNSRDDDSNQRTFVITNNTENVKKALQLNDKVSGTQKWYSVFGEHNKPSGSYTGNGSTTARTITTGGIGNLVFISGNGYSSIISPNGGFVWDSTSTVFKALPYSAVDFTNGVLSIKSDSDALNGNGKFYGWYLV